MVTISQEKKPEWKHGTTFCSSDLQKLRIFSTGEIVEKWVLAHSVAYEFLQSLKKNLAVGIKVDSSLLNKTI